MLPLDHSTILFTQKSVLKKNFSPFFEWPPKTGFSCVWLVQPLYFTRKFILNLECKNTICCGTVQLRCYKKAKFFFCLIQLRIYSLKLRIKNIFGQWEHGLLISVIKMDAIPPPPPPPKKKKKQTNKQKTKQNKQQNK